MNKTDLVKLISTSAKLTQSQASDALQALIDGITKSLKKGNEVRLVGFGTFKVKKRKAAEGRNPRTGAAIKIPASIQPSFKPGKGLKEAVNK